MGTKWRVVSTTERTEGEIGLRIKILSSVFLTCGVRGV